VDLAAAIWAFTLEGCRATAVVGDVRLDQARASTMACETCETVGLNFSAWRVDGERGHRGVAWCPHCMEAIEL
jgi:hypothetical protein